MDTSNDRSARSGTRGTDREANQARIDALLSRGVLIPFPEHVFLYQDVDVASGTLILPGTHLVGACTIGPDCRIGPDVWIEDATIEAGSTVWYSVIEKATVRRGARIGPFAHLRPGADIGADARVGNFVEVKASRLGPGVKAGHLAYIGDAEIGAGANIGAGAVTCNYDGKTKHKTVIDEGAFVGTNTSLVAPVHIGKNAVIAAGSAITDDVPQNATAFGRARQVNVETPKEDHG